MAKQTTTLKELQKFIKEKGKEYKTDLNDVPAWVLVACAEFIDLKNSNTIEDKLGNYICEDEEFYPKIIEALKKALEKNPDMMADEVEFDKGSDDEVNMETITMWEPLEYTLTVAQLCSSVGIE